MRAKRAQRRTWTHPSVLALIETDGTTNDPEQIIRKRARELVGQFADFGEGPPYDMDLLASLCGYRPKQVDFLGDDQDACISIGEMLINGSRPPVRQRYSIGHEIIHTFFPDFEREVRSTGPRWWRERDSQSEIEQLCQIGASELLMPVEAFRREMERHETSLAAVLSLAVLFEASPEAAVRRFVDLSDEPLVAVFLAMKHKPIEQRRMQQIALGLPGFDAPSEKLRVSYAVAAPRCDSLFVPPHKSVPEQSVACRVWQQATSGAAGPGIDRANEDWTEIGGLGSCCVEAITLPVEGTTPYAVLCLLHLEPQHFA